MFKKILFLNLIILFVLFAFINKVDAASFQISPEDGSLSVMGSTGCNKTIDIFINVPTETTNGAQIYIEHDFVSAGESFSISSGGLFTTYKNISELPAPLFSGNKVVGYLGYGGTKTGNNLRFARITVRTNKLLDKKNIIIRFNNDELLTSKIADGVTSENILTSVNSAIYTVQSGFCEAISPQIINVNPANQKPNHKVFDPITFQISDSGGSGVDIDTLALDINQDGWTGGFTISTNKINDDLYSVVVTPDASFIAERKVTWSVSVSDKAGNNTSADYYFNDLSCVDLGCSEFIPVLECSDGKDNDGDGLLDANDPGCYIDDVYVPDKDREWDDGFDGCPITEPCEVCEPCEEPCEVCEVCEICDNGEDDDEIIDPDLDDDDEEDVLIQKYLNTDDLSFFFDNKTIVNTLNKNNIIETLVQSPVLIALDTSEISETIKAVTFYFRDESYKMSFDQSLKKYTTNIIAPSSASAFSALVKVEYGIDGEENLVFSLVALPYGKVIGQIDNEFSTISNAVVTVEQLDSNNQYKLVRSFETDENGLYGFMVNNGAYKIIVRKDGYLISETSGFKVDNAIINRNFNLIKKVDLLDPEVPVAEKVTYVASVGLETVNNIVEARNDPRVENTVEKVVAPVAIATTLAMVVPALSLLSLFSYLRALLLIPLTLFSRKKRKEWGVVYNSLTKMPIDLISVRLIDDKTDRIVQTAVTDSKGRYKFFAEPGIYRLVVASSEFIYPTKILQDITEDTSFENIYHGAPIHIDENTSAIIQNIPIDPAGVNKTPRRIIISDFIHDVRTFIISVSLAVGALAMFIKPNLYIGILLAVQILFYILFKKASKQKKFKNYGVIFDNKSKKPISKVIVRLYDSKFNRLIATQVTDSKGRYSFLVGKNNYYLTIEKSGFNSRKIENINVLEKEDGVVDKDVALEKLVKQKDSSELSKKEKDKKFDKKKDKK